MSQSDPTKESGELTTREAFAQQSRVVLTRNTDGDLVAHTLAARVPWSGWGIGRLRPPLHWLGLCGVRGVLALDKGLSRDAIGCADCDVVELGLDCLK